MSEPVADFILTVKHHSIVAREVRFRGTLKKACGRASTLFGQGFYEHKIVVQDPETGEVLAHRYIGERKWTMA